MFKAYKFISGNYTQEIQLFYLWTRCLQTQSWGLQPGELHVCKSRTPSLAGTQLAEQHPELLAPCEASLPPRPLQALLLNGGSSFCCTIRKQRKIKLFHERVQPALHSSVYWSYGDFDLSWLPMKTVMKFRMFSRLSAEVSKISSANRRRKMKKSPRFSAKNSDKQKPNIIRKWAILLWIINSCAIILQNL